MAVRKATSSEPRSEASERLLVQAAQKDPARFAELYEAHFERVYAFIARRVQERLEDMGFFYDETARTWVRYCDEREVASVGEWLKRHHLQQERDAWEG